MDKSFYIGITDNIRRRLAEHNGGLSLATKNKRPWIIIYCEWYRSDIDARKRERQLKKHKSGWRWIKERTENSRIKEQN